MLKIILNIFWRVKSNKKLNKEKKKRNKGPPKLYPNQGTTKVILRETENCIL